MTLKLDERAEIVLLNGHQGWSQKQVADEFNARHPELQTFVLMAIRIC
jgi:creatinine amidohydrolase/Fe(II)-dependent formamide hydrolase-like protein